MNYKGTLQDCPCSKCETDRDDGCHCRCTKYIDWRRARVSLMAGVKSEVEKENRLTEYDIAKNRRIYKR